VGSSRSEGSGPVSMSSEKGARPRARASARTGDAGGGDAGAAHAGAAHARPRELSAGGVVVRGEPGHEQLLAIVPVRRAADGSSVLGLPKGHIDAGETPLQAAIREVREETGILAEPLGELGEVSYWYRRHGRSVPKSVAFFLFRPLSGHTADHDHEVEDARWIDLREACRTLTYQGERHMARRALERLAQGGQPS